MKQTEAEALFLLSKFEILTITKVANSYWPIHPDFYEIREQSPWWLVQTPFGLIKLGWRKRVIEIDWKMTGFEVDHLKDPLTKNQTTQAPHLIHAWCEADAVAYLTELHRRMHQKRARGESGRERVYIRRKIPSEFTLARIECESRGFVFEKETRGYTVNNQKGTEAVCDTLAEVWSTLEYDPEFAAPTAAPTTQTA